MDQIGVAMMPVAKPTEWRAFLDEASTGSRSDAHRDFLRRNGVTRERVVHQETPMGDVMILIWEGVDQDRMLGILGESMANPADDHERYLAEYVIAELHGIPADAPPPKITPLLDTKV